MPAAGAMTAASPWAATVALVAAAGAGSADRGGSLAQAPRNTRTPSVARLRTERSRIVANPGSLANELITVY